MRARRRVLFVTWDGPAQTYLESLFLPIFQRVPDAEFEVLQFSWADADGTNDAQRRLEAQVCYTRVPVWRRRPLALSTAATLARGAGVLARHVRERSIDTVLPRSILPAGMALLALRGDERQRIVYDADGLAADERVDFADWSPLGAQYRVWREVEAQAVRAARAVITRTQASRRILLARAGSGTPAEKIFVVPNAKDELAFTPGSPETRAEARRAAGVAPDAPWLVFAGSLGPQYHPAEMLQLFEQVCSLRPDARLHVFTLQSSAIESLVAHARVPAGAVTLTSAPPREISACLAAADVGLSLRSTAFSQRAVCPIKVAEYLLCGVPVLATRGVGDLDALLSSEVGVVLSGTGDSEIRRAAHFVVDEILPRREAFRLRCRELGLRAFSLAEAAAGYDRALSFSQ